MNDKELLQELDAFLDRYGIADTTFGLRVTNDSHLVRRMRDGKQIRRSTVLKVRKWMRRFELDAA